MKRAAFIGALLGASVVAGAFALRDLAPPHALFRTCFALVAFFLAPPIVPLNESMIAPANPFESPLLRYAGYALCNAALYAGAACWLVRTSNRGLLLQVAPLILLPITSFFFWVYRAMSDF